MKKIDYFIKKYLENRPLFLALLRPMEAFFFQKHRTYLRHPILDFGCGDGFFAQITFGKNNIDVGLDLKKSRINEAEKSKTYKKLIIYDGNKIPLPDNCFSTVISNSVLEHIPYLKHSLKEIHRILKPGGFFLASVMTKKWEDYLLGAKLFGHLYKNYMRKKQNHFYLLSYENWCRVFEKSGFIKIKTIGYLSKKASSYLDLFHYLSIPSLLSYKLSKSWVNRPIFFLNKHFERLIENIGNQSASVSIKKAAALFFILKKASLDHADNLN